MNQPFLADRSSADDATRLHAAHGVLAAALATRAAEAARRLGNVRHFCRWRQIAMLVRQLEATAGHTRH